MFVPLHIIYAILKAILIYIYIYIIEKLNKPSFGYNKFISAGKSIKETNFFKWL